jgi:hypothetical protein
MDDGAKAIILISIAISIVVIGGIVVFVGLVQQRCAACRKPALELDTRDNPGGIDTATGAHAFRCTRCGAEYRRLERGPFIPREAFEAGARDALAAAKVVRR